MTNKKKLLIVKLLNRLIPRAGESEPVADTPPYPLSKVDRDFNVLSELERHAKLKFGADWYRGLGHVCEMHGVPLDELDPKGERKILKILKQQ